MKLRVVRSGHTVRARREVCTPDTHTKTPLLTPDPSPPQPLVDEAKRAVGNIKSESLSEIRSLRMPPDVIQDILAGVLRLIGIYDTPWGSVIR